MISPETLRRYPLFAGQNYYMLKEIALLADEIELEAGDWLFQEREDATKFYVVLEGAISLCMTLHLNGSDPHVEAMSPIGKGEVVGWSSLVKPYIYTLGARAARKSKVVAIEAPSLRELLNDNPQYGYYLLKNLSEVMGERLVNKCVQLVSIVLDLQSETVKSPT
jgi:CRP/FNR family cyclic AMP-dependent transcriptional regulator